MHIALLEDESTLAQEVSLLLTKAGHSVVVFADGHSILRGLLKDTFDLFVLDWYVPGPDGLEVLRHLRENAKLNTPVVFLTAIHQEDQIAKVLDAGADDYCAKPLRPIEFLARVAAVQRRMMPQTVVEAEGELVEGYVFNRVERSVRIGGEKIDLTEKEFDLCQLLFTNLERPLSRNRIMQEVWGREEDALSRTLDVHISWVRRKLGIGAQGQTLRLNVVHGYGYRLDKVNP
ncbi:MAG: response regulator transcription factor [Limnohabitans sp.]|nr:MAG: response regulator transcription factor [Limnohabitans sp.]